MPLDHGTKQALALVGTHRDEICSGLGVVIAPQADRSPAPSPVKEGALLYTLESLLRGEMVGVITVPAETTRWANVALERMLALKE